MKKLISVLVLVSVVLSLFIMASCSGKKSEGPKKTALDFVVRDINNNMLDLAQFKGKVVMMVNTATECGLTPQFSGLQKLYDTYKDKGFIIIGFPSNSFKQESKSEEQIVTFCNDNFLVGFPMTRKVNVKDPEQHEIFKFLTDPATSKFPGIMRWNFEKFLISRSGEIINRFAPEVTPDDSSLVSAIEAAIADTSAAAVKK